jgi:hypothetical protein
MLGLRVISELTSLIPSLQSQNYKLFFDKFFTSMDILAVMKMRNLKATGTVIETRIRQCLLIPAKDIEKQKGSGFCDYCFDKEK